MTSTAAPTLARWVTFERAEQQTGLGMAFFHAHTTDGTWAEGPIWKWVLGRKMIDLEALYAWIDQQPSIASNRGRRKDPSRCHPERQPEPA